MPEDDERDFSPWGELLELLREERAFFLMPLALGAGLCGLLLVGAQLAGPLAPFLYPGW